MAHLVGRLGVLEKKQLKKKQIHEHLSFSPKILKFKNLQQFQHEKPHETGSSEKSSLRSSDGTNQFY